MKFKLLLLATLCITINSYSMNAMQDSEDGQKGEDTIQISNETENPTLGGQSITKALSNNKLLVAGICASALLAMRKYESTKQLLNGLPLIKHGSHEAALVSAISRGSKYLCLTYIITEILNYRQKNDLEDQLNDLFNKFSAMTLSALPSMIVTNGKVRSEITKYLTVTMLPKKFLRFIIRFLPKTKTKIANQIKAIAKESGQAAALLSTIILYKLMTALPGWMQTLYLKSKDVGSQLFFEILNAK